MYRKFGIPMAVVAAFALTACPPPEEQPAIPPAEEETPTEAMVEQMVEVTNELGETLTVVAIVEDREQHLGTVEPGMTEHFTVTGPEGTSADIEARDATGEVLERESISLSREARDWRIQERDGLDDRDPDATY